MLDTVIEDFEQFTENQAMITGEYKPLQLQQNWFVKLQSWFQSIFSFRKR